MAAGSTSSGTAFRIILCATLGFALFGGPDLSALSERPAPAKKSPNKATQSRGSTVKSPKPSSKAHKAQSSKAAAGQKSTKKTKSRQALKRKPRGPVIRGQREIAPERVTEIQRALAAAGFYGNEFSGKWDQATTEAMSSYQESNGFKVTGKPDALSLKKLGL